MRRNSALLQEETSGPALAYVGFAHGSGEPCSRGICGTVKQLPSSVAWERLSSCSIPWNIRDLLPASHRPKVPSVRLPTVIEAQTSSDIKQTKFGMELDIERVCTSVQYNYQDISRPNSQRWTCSPQPFWLKSKTLNRLSEHVC